MGLFNVQQRIPGPQKKNTGLNSRDPDSINYGSGGLGPGPLIHN